jgi:hypothetical protein
MFPNGATRKGMLLVMVNESRTSKLVSKKGESKCNYSDLR